MCCRALVESSFVAFDITDPTSGIIDVGFPNQRSITKYVQFPSLWAKHLGATNVSIGETSSHIFIRSHGKPR